LYIHRSGRTARVGRAGICVTFFDLSNVEYLTKVEKLAGIKMTRVNLNTLEEILGE